MTFHVRIEHNDLAATAAWAARALPARPANAILRGMVLDTAGGNLIVSAFDYDTAVSGWCSADVKDEGRVIVSGKLFAETVAKLPARPVELELGESSLALSCGATKARFPLLPVEDYPSLPEAAPRLGKLDAAELRDLVSAVAHAADKGGNGRDHLMGVHLVAESGMLTCSAIDSYQLARASMPWAGPDGTALIPAAELSDLVKHLSGEVSIGWTEHLFSLSASGRSASTRLLAGEFPIIGRFFDLPKDPTVAYVDVADLVAAVKLAEPFIPDKRPVILGIEDGQLTVGSSAQDEGELGGALDATVTGEPMTIGFKPAYLLAALASLRSPLARICAFNSNRHVRFDPAATVDDGPSGTRTCIVMPIKPGSAQ